ncbi:MAG TPA: serine hydrolase [Candidatus Baltobacteraceae bacterium]|nr:serine hydrolase [Candidatus Baltobacteraceae bacterium]
MNVDAAAAYHARHKPRALLVLQDGAVVYESYEEPFSAQTPHALYSGTKSFWGTAAVIAQREGLLHLDDPVWHGATFRQLLNLTCGAPFGGLGAAVPTYEKALATSPRFAPGERFTYGGIPLQIFGAVFAQRLVKRKQTPHEYLHERILDPERVVVESWRTLKDGTQPLPTGAFLTAPAWARYGSFVLRSYAELSECFVGSLANPRYGLGWWLRAGAMPNLFYASGSGGQAMYVCPSARVIVVRFGNGGSFNHQAFLKQIAL